MKWFRNSYGVIVNGIGWEIAKDTTDSEDYDEHNPWSLFHHGEYVGNYATTEDAKADVDFSDCSKCREWAGE